MSLVLVPHINQHVLRASSAAKVKVPAQAYLLVTSPQKDNTQQFVLMVGTPTVAQIPAIFAQLATSAQKPRFPLFHRLYTSHHKVTHSRVW